jgi:hypothetical protein
LHGEVNPQGQRFKIWNFRTNKDAVMIVAHSGRDGKNMRGTSRREDASFSVIRLDDLQETGEPRNGARFLMCFTKDRNSSAEQAVREWVFQTQPNGDVEISSKQTDGIEMVLQWVWNGLNSCSEIAEEM